MLLERAGATVTRLHHVQRLYAAFARCDGEAMQALYAPQATFDDPLFSLRGAREIGGMWRMLCRSARKRSAKVWRLAAEDIQVDGDRGRAHWEATYLFGPADREVHNVVDAAFEFDEAGLILRHVDHFDFAVWAGQALGWPGQLFGGSSLMQRLARRQARDRLARFLASNL